MAKRSVRRRRRDEARNAAGVGTAPVKGAVCVADDCAGPGIERVNIPGSGDFWVCGMHARMVRVQIARNENVARLGRDLDRAQLERELGVYDRA